MNIVSIDEFYEHCLRVAVSFEASETREKLIENAESERADMVREEAYQEAYDTAYAEEYSKLIVNPSYTPNKAKNAANDYAKEAAKEAIKEFWES